ncbi:MAG: hypothetical protein ACYTFQ_17970 [Planctomycetota bacterium]|jgi:hypothetical protein
MRYKAKSSKRDILVALGSLAVLLMNLNAVGGAGRRRAKAMVCLSNLNQWGRMFEMFTSDNDGYFSSGLVANAGWHRGEWIIGLRPYIEPNTNLLCCPEATKQYPNSPPWGGPFNAYVMPSGGFQDQQQESSYGANCWLYNPPPGVATIQGRPTEWNWRSVAVQGANSIPVFADSMFRGGGPYDSGIQSYPPVYNGQWLGYNMEMMHFCIDRHDGATDVLFMDWSARKTGLKQLWTLKWHRTFNTDGPWTEAGGALPADWPSWMRNFRTYQPILVKAMVKL